jgi:hypothetical protein
MAMAKWRKCHQRNQLSVMAQKCGVFSWLKATAVAINRENAAGNG